MTIKKMVETMDVQEGTLDMFQKIMNGIKLTKQELRNNRQALKIDFCEMRQELKEIQDSMRKENKDRSGKPKKDERKIKGKVQTMEIGLNMDLEKDLDFLVVMDPGDKYYGLELSAVPEGIDEEIGDKDIIGSKKFLDWKDLMELEMEKVYRINPCFVSMEKPSRDVLVYSVKKRNRDAALQQYFSDTFGIDGKEISVIKEIPIRLLLYDYDSKIIGCVKMEDGRWNQHG
ncbi:cyclin-dependent kinase 4 inhibitor C isoform X1 [Rhineura floridana]|uniref:cyclin-dependent kinase 4 inhibitor C isoform X1 n=1 Tax=Rhineura floridana TaxID=261503 RepID=UPI002AC81B61|nr:cyclin-dependent kinase 4 inhibitor C isoform X1 [Rhineura floridana]XP_061488930.1 cyclin-dependent kinase 4 inhibitor C isoform X1 [Rhineura floridana]